MYSPVFGHDDFADDETGSYGEPPFTLQPACTPSPPPAPNSQPAGRIPSSQSYAAHTPLASNPSNGAAPLLDAHIDDISPLLDILRCLQLDKPSTAAASAFPSPNHPNTPPLLLHCQAVGQGLKLIVNRHKTLSARGYLKSNLFSHYQINSLPPPQPQQPADTVANTGTVSFTVSLRRLLSVLEVNAMGGRGTGGGGGGSGGGSLFLRVMAGVGTEASELVLELTDEGSVTTCQLACLVQLEEDDETEQLQFASAPVVARGTIPVSSQPINHPISSSLPVSSSHCHSPLLACDVVQSHILYAVFSELVLNGSDDFTLLFQDKYPQLRAAVLTEGVSVLSSVGLPTTATSATAVITPGFTDFTFIQQSSPPPLRLSYPLALITAALTVLSLSEHTNVRVNESGLLSLQNVISTRMTDVSNWVELVCAAREESGMEGELTTPGKAWGQRLFTEQDIIIE